MSKNKLLIIVPSYNEAKNLARLIPEIKKVKSADLLIINDGLTDNSVEELNKLRKNYDFSIIDQKQNLGLSQTVFQGLKWAKKHNYAFVLRLDGDGQHNPKDARKMLVAIEETRTNLIIGSRFLKKNNYQVQILRRIVIKYFKIIFQLLDLKIKDPTSGMWLYDQKTYLFIINQKLQHLYEPALLVKLAFNNFKIKEVPVKMRQRKFGRSSINFFKGLSIVHQLNKQILIIFVQNKVIKH